MPSRYTVTEIAGQTRRVLEMRAKGMSFKSIGLALGIGKNAAECRAKSVRDPKPAALPPIDLTAKWTEGRRRFARILHRRRYGLANIAEELNQQFPGAPLTGFDVRAELYGARL